MLLELCQNFVHLIVRIATSTGGVYRFSAESTGRSFFIQIGALGCTSAFKFTIFDEKKPHRHQDEEQSYKAEC